MTTLSFHQVTKSQFWQAPSLRGPFFVAAITIFIQILSLVLFFSQLPPQVPLFYSLPWGPSQLTSPFYLWLLPTLSLLTLTANWFLAHLTQDRFTRQLLWITTALITTMAAYTLVHILLTIS